MKNLIITKRQEDYHICFEDDKTIWESGKTRADCVLNFVLTHKEKLGIDKILEERIKQNNV